MLVSDFDTFLLGVRLGVTRGTYYCGRELRHVLAMDEGARNYCTLTNHRIAESVMSNEHSHQCSSTGDSTNEEPQSSASDAKADIALECSYDG